MHRFKSSSTYPETFKINGHTIFDKSIIANEFIDFFANVGSNLSSSMYFDIDNTMITYLANPLPQTFDFEPVDEKSILKIVNNKRLRDNGSRASGDGMKVTYICE